MRISDWSQTCALPIFDPQPSAIDSLPNLRIELPNKQRRRIGLYFILAALDGAAIAIALALASLFLFDDPLGWQSARLTGIIVPLFVALALSQRAYSVESLADPGRGARRSVLRSEEHTSVLQ